MSSSSSTHIYGGGSREQTLYHHNYYCCTPHTKGAAGGFVECMPLFSSPSFVFWLLTFSVVLSKSRTFRLVVSSSMFPWPQESPIPAMRGFPTSSCTYPPKLESSENTSHIASNDYRAGGAAGSGSVPQLSTSLSHGELMRT